MDTVPAEVAPAPDADMPDVDMPDVDMPDADPPGVRRPGSTSGVGAGKSRMGSTLRARASALRALGGFGAFDILVDAAAGAAAWFPDRAAWFPDFDAL